MFYVPIVNVSLLLLRQSQYLYFLELHSYHI
nr:MAG TPA: UPF0730 protein [Caudoviricetes sp.]